jgi:lipid-binding SYLF domain-containing protein
MRNLTTLVLVLIVSAALTGCTTPKGDTGDDKRQSILKMRDETLARLYRHKPEAREEVEKAAGYAVFSNVGLTVLVVGAGDGYGVAVDNATGKTTFMKMGQGALALGLGVKDFRAVFVFREESTFRRFVDKGWEFGGEASAEAKSGDKGGESTAAGSVQHGVRIYQFSQSGVELKAAIPLTKYWKYDELN